MFELGLLLVHSLHRHLGARLVFLGPFRLAGVTSAIRSLLFGRLGFVINIHITVIKALELPDAAAWCC